MDQQFSKNALLTFLETVVRQGLVNSNTAAGWKAAFSRILEDVPDQEDVRKIDVPTAIKRYHNKHPGELKPTSLKEYERRLVVLLKDFTKYAENPSTFKPRGRTPRGDSIGTTPRKKVGAAKIAPDPASVPADQRSSILSPQPIAGLSLEFPMRPDFLAQVVVPRDMKADEARRLSRFIMTLAHDYSPQKDDA